MSDKKLKIKTLAPIADPTTRDAVGSAVIIARGATLEIAKFWADHYVGKGVAELVIEKVTKEKSK